MWPTDARRRTVAGAGAGAKMVEATAKGVEVWTEQEFVDAISGKAGGKKKAAAVAPDQPAAKKAKAVAASPSKKVASTVVTSTTDGDGANADPDAMAALTADGLKNVAVTAHHKLVQIDVATNSDKYYLMQSLSGELTKGRKKEEQHYVFTRWGRTGTKGQARAFGSDLPSSWTIPLRNLATGARVLP